MSLKHFLDADKHPEFRGEKPKVASADFAKVLDMALAKKLMNSESEVRKILANDAVVEAIFRTLKDGGLPAMTSAVRAGGVEVRAGAALLVRRRVLRVPAASLAAMGLPAAERTQGGAQGGKKQKQRKRAPEKGSPANDIYREPTFWALVAVATGAVVWKSFQAEKEAQAKGRTGRGAMARKAAEAKKSR